ncbi:hypothetical protein BH11PSE9_BH11PSE9_23650 [soil metagenome]
MSAPSPKLSRRASAEWAGLLALLLVLTVIFAGLRWRGYVSTAQEERERLQLQAETVSNHLALLIQAVGHGLQVADSEAAVLKPPVDLAIASTHLHRLADAAVAVENFRVLGPGGELLLSSDVADTGGGVGAGAAPGAVMPAHIPSACLERVRARPAPARIFACEPFQTARGDWTFDLVLPRLDPEGEFAGVVAATLDVGYLRAVLPPALHSPDMRALLLNGSGIVIVASPQSGVPSGADLRAERGSMFNSFLALGQKSGVVEGVSQVKGDRRIVAYHTVEPKAPQLDQPLLLSLGRGRTAAFHAWWLATGLLVLGWLLTALVASAALYLVQRRLRWADTRLAVLERERLDELERIELVVGAAGVSLWDLDVATDRLTLDAHWWALVGCPAGDLVRDADEWRQHIHREDGVLLRDQLRRHFEGEIPLAKSEYRVRQADGQWVWLLAHGRAIARDAAGAPLRVVGTLKDITERRQAEQAVRASEAQLRLITDAMPGAVARLDIERRFIFTNPALEHWLSEPARPVLGRQLRDVLGPEKYATIDKRVQRVEAGERLTFEMTLKSVTQGTMQVFVDLLPDRDASGAVCGHIAVLTDLTELRAAELERRALDDHLRESQKMDSIGTLAGGIAHDFNNVLGAIIGNAELAQQEVGDSHPALTSLRQITLAGQRARGLVQQILTFSRKQPEQLVEQPLRPLVEETLAMLRATLPARVELRDDLTEAPLYVNADATQMHQVLMNLGTNAWHALQGSSGRIVVGLAAVKVGNAGGDGSLEAGGDSGGDPSAGKEAHIGPPAELAPGHYAHLWVRDDGTGMDDATRRRIFEPFFTTKPIGEGTGLGLAVVHGIVQTHLGAITLESAPGQGTCFHVYLPATERPSQVGVLEEAERQTMRGRGQHVMYVDDDEVMVLLVLRLLGRAGYRVTTCRSAREALAAFLDQPRAFDLVITDFNMPGFSGLELAAELARVRPEMPVVISSGYLSEELQGGAQRAGIRHLLKKQNTFEDLAGIVGRALLEVELRAEAKAAP